MRDRSRWFVGSSSSSTSGSDTQAAASIVVRCQPPDSLRSGVCFKVLLFGGKGIEDEVMKRLVKPVVRHILRDAGNATPACCCDVAMGLFDLACEACQQRWFASAIGRHEAKPVAFGECEVEVSKERLTIGDAEIAKVDQWSALQTDLQGKTGTILQATGDET